MKQRETTADHNYVLQVNAEHASKAHTVMESIIQETLLSKASPSQDDEEGSDDDLPP